MDPTPRDLNTEGFTLDERDPVPVKSLLELFGDAVASLPMLTLMLYRLLRDAAVPRRKKLLAAAAVAYVASPIDLIPDFIPVAGAMDDLIVVALAIHLLIDAVPEEVQRAYWEGSEDVFEVVRGLVTWGAEMVPAPVRRLLS